ncbi:N-acetylmuramoyl-L-alanine amidase [Bacillus infantis]|uniref:N-acetylmuramoyl-L-alanine amidase n=1 Tax=Bacillus infantis TaxID=324767 RepID=UPI003CF0D20C
MAISSIPKYKDIRKTIRRNGSYPYVGTAVKDTHVIHHSMTAQHLGGSTPQGFADYHIDSNGWPGIAYAFVIGVDGTIYQCDDLDRRTYHAGNTNTRSIGTCLIGDFRKEGAAEVPSPEQLESLYLLNRDLYKVLPNMKRTIGHQECPGYAWKNCPGDTWSYKDVLSGRIVQPLKKGDDDLELADARLKARPVEGRIGVLKVLDNTVLREEPDNKSKVIRDLEPGGEYKVSEYKEGWFRVGGWVHSEYVNFLPNEKAKVTL